MLDLEVPGTLENIHEPDQISVHVSMRILDGIAHARLGSEIHHPVETLALEQGVHGLTFSDVELHEMKSRVLEPFQPGTLQAHIVITVEIIDTYDRVTTIEQLACDCRADEAGCAGNEDFHRLGLGWVRLGAAPGGLYGCQYWLAECQTGFHIKQDDLPAWHSSDAGED